MSDFSYSASAAREDAREDARRADGTFGPQHQPEAEVELSAPAADPAVGEPWEAGSWDWLVIALKARRKDPQFCLLELEDAARVMGRQDVFDRHAYRTRNPVEDFDRIVTELAAGRRGRHLLTGEPLPDETVEAVGAALHFEGMDLEALGVTDAEAAAELARVAVEAESYETSRDAMATHMEVNWRASQRGAKYAAGSVCAAFGIPDHRSGFGY